MDAGQVAIGRAERTAFCRGTGSVRKSLSRGIRHAGLAVKGLESCVLTHEADFYLGRLWVKSIIICYSKASDILGYFL